ncbi:hypothetical protein RJ639_023495, partial [Escallonia herrerae]
TCFLQINENVQREIINHRSLRQPNIFRVKEAGFFSQQLISGVSYCHEMSSVLHLKPKSTVGTPACTAPEVLLRQEYDGKVTSCLAFITLRSYCRCLVVLGDIICHAGCGYPFEDPEEPKDFRKTIHSMMPLIFFTEIGDNSGTSSMLSDGYKIIANLRNCLCFE